MIINHNLPAMNTYNKLTANNAATSKSLEKLSSGLRINRAGDDAAGLAISEKMRGQIRGLDQATRNSQDAISMIQTAEGNLSETQSILQRMKELATQAASDTNVGVDRGEIQKEINQLSSEINRIGNTTEFNTQKLLMGDGRTNVDKTTLFTDIALSGGKVSMTQASQKTSFGAQAAAGNSITFKVNGQDLKITFAATGTAGKTNMSAYDVTSNSATINISSGITNANTATAIKNALTSMIAENTDLKGNFVTSVATGAVTISAVKGTAADGANGSIGAVLQTGMSISGATGIASVGTTNAIQAGGSISLGAASTLIGKGITVNGKAVEFYDATKGAYTGEGIGVDVAKSLNASATLATISSQISNAISGVTVSSTATKLIVKANDGGTAGNLIKIEDGGIQKDFEATFQVGANQGQSFKISISDMRSVALGVTGTIGGTDAETGAVFTSANVVTNGTDATNREAALDVSSYEHATNAIKTLSNAIEKVSAERSKLGAYQNRLEHTITNLTTSSENTSAAESRIRDVDMAKEMMNFQKNNILSQAAQAMLAQANQQPQNVLQLLR